MKTRQGFVSNSSTTTFICQVCNEEVGGMDLCIDDAGMFRCANDHTMCLSHALGGEYLSLQNKRDYVISYSSSSDENKEKAETLNDEDFEEFFDSDSGFSYDIIYNYLPSLCPICQFQEADTDDIMKYLLLTCEKTKEQILNELKEKFGDYKDFRKAIEGENNENKN